MEICTNISQKWLYSFYTILYLHTLFCKDWQILLWYDMIIGHEVKDNKFVSLPGNINLSWFKYIYNNSVKIWGYH